VHLPDGRHNKRVRDILKRIDPDTPLDSTVSMEATRACLEAARIFPGTAEYREAGYSKYTDHERRAALLGNISGSLTMKVCTDVKYLDTTETCFMGATSTNLLETIGDPDSRLSLGEKMREVVHAKGEEMLKCAASPRDQKAAKRLIDAQCTPAFVRKQYA